jgi:hypothetical protein
LEQLSTFIEFSKYYQSFINKPSLFSSSTSTVLVVALIHAFQTSDKFRQGIQKLGNAFITFAEGALNFVIEHMNVF